MRGQSLLFVSFTDFIVPCYLYIKLHQCAPELKGDAVSMGVASPAPRSASCWPCGASLEELPPADFAPASALPTTAKGTTGGGLADHETFPPKYFTRRGKVACAVRRRVLP